MPNTLHSQALQYLEQDSMLHIDMLEALQHNNGTLLYASQYGVLIRMGQILFLSATQQDAALTILSNSKDISLLVTHQNNYTSALLAQYPLEHLNTCYNVAYLHKAPLDTSMCTLPIKPLGLEHANFVAQHYSTFDDMDYITQRLQMGTMYGAFDNGQMAGFIGVHEEGAIGMLEVLPQYRRQGLATALQAYMTNLFLSEGKIPFGQVATTNHASLALQKKLGYTASANTIQWFYASS